MNEAIRLAAWLDANAKHMKYEEEAIQMRKAARELRNLNREIQSNLEALNKAKTMLQEIKGLAYELSKQETPGGGKRIALPGLWR